MFHRILVATDGSELADKAVSKAIALAAMFEAELVALTVVPRQPRSYMEGSSSVQSGEIARVDDVRAEQARTMIEAVEKRAKARGIPVRTATVKSNQIGDSIVAAARTHGSQLIVMASHGRRGLARAVLGSATDHVLTHSALPVLVLR